MIILKKENYVLLTVLCKHAHSDLQSTEVFLDVIGTSHIM